MSSEILDIEAFRQQMVDICERELGMSREKLLAGVPFLELDKYFDSLSLVQLQLSVEEVHDVAFDMSAFTVSVRAALPANLDEFTAFFYPHLIQLLKAKQ